jgi:transcriptional regulator of acetoin/glycerol metabolism
MDVLMAYNWPWNMRELQHVAKFAVAISESSRIDPAALPLALRASGSAVHGMASVQGLKPRRDADAILAALNSERWNVSSAAKRLGISRATLHRKIVEFDLVRPKQR